MVFLDCQIWCWISSHFTSLFQIWHHLTCLTSTVRWKGMFHEGRWNHSWQSGTGPQYIWSFHSYCLFDAIILTHNFKKWQISWSNSHIFVYFSTVIHFEHKFSLLFRKTGGLWQQKLGCSSRNPGYQTRLSFLGWKTGCCSLDLNRLHVHTSAVL